ncbi:polysaccharide biosynthesis tyrosine autokinase [Bradyrhizobium sp. WSM471]|uniref:polysaccharide biosynthesis tyrosine autokinase n=1 Tax=Bradyrhizobium sp. WSM471 TaxID=319017 RepID=UPI00024D238C|nr:MULTISPECIES: polysaccharide biosynthesis tyrosine autokinase [Bradyrhizobium]EHR01465.1 capsular exopolysaccharide biosynthesis protein [Bradyrhizobium sp. WSM471]UFW43520.1 polysaccharide biosynthesis tyrosine autokinase [Bradyrhizobium canariense]
MLQNTDRSRTALGNADGPPPGGATGIGPLVNLARGFLRRQYAIVIFGAVLALAAGLIYLRITPPTYTAQVRILLGNQKAQFIQQQSAVAEPSFDPREIETQLQILRSKAIASDVIDKLDLTADLTRNTDSPLTLMGRRLRKWFGGTPGPDESESQARLAGDVMTAFQERLTAARVNLSNVIELTFSWNDAARAAQIANAIADAYIADQLNAKFEANRTATLWLQQRIKALGDQAETAERAVNAYRSQNNIFSTEGKPIDEQQVTQVNSRIVAARAQTAELLARLNRYESILKENPSKGESIGTLDASGSDALASPIINSLRQQYLELVRRESEWSARFGKDHLSVVNLRARMREIRASVLDEVRRLAETSRSDYEVSKQRQQDLEKQLSEAVSVSRATNSAEVTLRELESRAKGYRTLYDTFLQRYMGSAQQESFPISDARVIYPASIPQSKSKPKTTIILAIALFGGLGLGVGLGLLRETMDRVFRTPDQLEAALRLPCLSVVPLLQAARLRKLKASLLPDRETGRRTVSTHSPLHWAVMNMPLSRFAESIRSIKLGIDLNPTQTTNKVIGITSSLPHEGKSTIAASLAQLIGQGGKSVILVDCDLRNPSLSKALAPDASVGLLEVIFEKCSLEEAIWQEPKTNLAFLPVVKIRPLLHSSELLATEHMRKLFARLRTTYDYVIVDLPPLTPIVDVRATATLVDCFMLVVEWGKTKIDVVQHALHTAPNVYENLIGVVLNKTDIRAMLQYDSHRSDYYSDDHYVHYGLTDA